MRQKLEISPIFNNVLFIEVYDNWEQRKITGEFFKKTPKTDKMIIYLIWEKIIKERVEPNENHEIPIIFNVILRIFLHNQPFVTKLIERISYLVNIKELDNDFDFVNIIDKEFDDLIKYLEEDYELYKKIAMSDRDLSMLSGEILDQEISFHFSRNVIYPT